jgi:hypothetical protein
VIRGRGTSKRPNVQALKNVEKKVIFGWKEVTPSVLVKEWQTKELRDTELGRVYGKRKAASDGSRNGNRSPPHPGWFFAKSSELLENKRVEFLLSAKEFARV